MKDEIIQKLEQIEVEHNIKILYACESGSRAWGFSSPDSDYDVRFIYMRKPDLYLSVFEQEKDVIELPIDALLDINGWDLNKALCLSHKNNFALFEWLHSPIVYKDLGVQKLLQEFISEVFREDRGHYHYLSMANRIYKRHIKKKKQPTIKKLFYALRTILCTMWIEKHKTMPPVEFEKMLSLDFLSKETIDEIGLLREEKKVKNEADKADNCRHTIAFIEQEIARLSELNPTDQASDKDEIDKLFKKILTDYAF